MIVLPACGAVMALLPAGVSSTGAFRRLIAAGRCRGTLEAAFQQPCGTGNRGMD